MSEALLSTNSIKVHAVRLLMDAGIEPVFVDIVPIISGDLMLKVQTASDVAWATLRADMDLNMSIAQWLECYMRPAVHKIIDELQALKA